MARGQVTLSPHALTYLCEHYDLNLHPMVRVGRMPRGADEDQTRQALERGRRELIDRRLLDGQDLDPFVGDAIHLLARPPVAVGVAVRSEEGTSFNAVLVEHGRSTVQAYQADGEDAEQVTDLHLTRHEFGGPSGNAVNLLGRLPQSQGQSASVPSELIDRMAQRLRDHPSGGIQAALSAAGVKRADAQVLAKVFTAKRTSDAVLTVQSYDDKVRRTHRLPFNLQIFVTEEGGYFSQKKPDGNGREWTTVAPADGRKISTKLEEMASYLVGPR
ncbi:hypothetical protein FHX42_004887 [Saccharopolyspora lacisalsi]|uniref:ESX secretion-associated protein EspG n=1 Tax=Halosaccharopolyspora lacisalsi TaxID=1000566 RepID=A0A839E894_9PSEU|nr:ESX secretion-associated protein EspG [Halosaccharopolyspora lacisalsi]MBA8827491.1 hypothetical protein [Halosaccharopolyspora lacisalsi]